MFYIKAGINRYTIPAIIEASIPNNITGCVIILLSDFIIVKLA